MPDRPARSGSPAGPGSPPSVPEAVSWRRMGSSGPLFTRVAEQVERFIAGNGLVPGDRLPGERELCRLLGVSRASVREALRSLQARGVVTVRHGKGVFVAEPGEDAPALRRLAMLREIGMDELFAMREVLEVPAAGWAATAASDEQLRVVEESFDELEEAVLGRRAARELQALDSRLHLLIAEYASNRFLAMTQSALQEMLARSMETTLAIPGRPARSLREHAEIVQALAARDPARARAAARRHIRSAHRAAVRRMSDPGSRLSVPAARPRRNACRLPARGYDSRGRPELIGPAARICRAPGAIACGGRTPRLRRSNPASGDRTP